MGDAIWASWFDLEPDTADDTLGWLMSEHLPWLAATGPYRWVALYHNAGYGPALKDYHAIAGHAEAEEGLGTGSQYVTMVGAGSSHDFYAPLCLTRDLPAGHAARLAARKGLREAILVEEARAPGRAAAQRRADGVPAPAIQFGSFRVDGLEAEADINCWYAQQRFRVMEAMPGCLITRKFLVSTGWARHAILYEFESLAARTQRFEEPEESKINDPAEWTGRIVRTTRHTPGSPVVGERLWPPVDPAETGGGAA